MYVNSNCVGCSQCVAFCKHGAITAKGRAVITEKCRECRVCMLYCPMKAIVAGQKYTAEV
ncbi:MAG: 4Fe-4S binding protein [Methanimicrococcus sp.]|nr:4Fe-4S binding protein [Methanimicrococcus sp.]